MKTIKAVKLDRTCWYTNQTCNLCGCVVATNGTDHWCPNDQCKVDETDEFGAALQKQGGPRRSSRKPYS